MKRIRLDDWAMINSVSNYTAQKWARTGRLSSACKEGGVWMINENQPKPEGE